MFQSSKKEQIDERKDANSTLAASVILADTEIIGDVNTGSSLRIDGQLKGNINVKARMVIGPKGRVEGQIICADATIEGEFHGELRATESVSIKEKGMVVGKITTQTLSVSPGAVLRGQVEANTKTANTAAHNPKPQVGSK